MPDKVIPIRDCYGCPFFGSEGNLMVCNHPETPKDDYKNLITKEIIQKNKVARFCPLVRNDYTITYKLEKPE